MSWRKRRKFGLTYCNSSPGRVRKTGSPDCQAGASPFVTWLKTAHAAEWSSLSTMARILNPFTHEPNSTMKMMRQISTGSCEGCESCQSLLGEKLDCSHIDSGAGIGDSSGLSSSCHGACDVMCAVCAPACMHSAWFPTVPPVGDPHETYAETPSRNCCFVRLLL
jgi:hypothetical protein